MKLYDLPRKSKLMVTLTDGKRAEAVFDHLDGAYSYCYLKHDESKVFHLSGGTPMRQVDDYYEIDEPEVIEDKTVIQNRIIR